MWSLMVERSEKPYPISGDEKYLRELEQEVQRLRAKAYPHVQGTCPACHSNSLFLGEGGYVTCGMRPCPQPDLVSDLLIEGLEKIARD